MFKKIKKYKEVLYITGIRKALALHDTELTETGAC